MTVGDGDKPTDEYQRGFTAGYQRRVREELESWKAVIEGGQLVAFGEIIRATPFAEREQERLTTVRAAHDAGVHGHSARGCPWCDGTANTVVGRWHGSHCVAPGHVHTGIEANRYGGGCDVVLDSYLPVGKPHSGNYGVPRGGDFACPGRAAAGPSSRPVCGMPDWDHDAHMYGPGSTVIPHYDVAACGGAHPPGWTGCDTCRNAQNPESRDWGAVDHLVRASRAFRKQHPNSDYVAPLGVPTAYLVDDDDDARTIGSFRCTVHGMRGCPTCGTA